MNLKKIALIILFTLFCFVSFADDTYKLSVVNANDMSVSDDIVVLEGGVEVVFTTNENDMERKLTADKVIIDVENKFLDAIGNVYLSEGKDSTFQGQSISLNWDTLDIVVFGGTSSSDRSNASGSKVKFYVVGDRISYAGKNDSVFFEDGVISTTAVDPYWSVAANKIGLAGSDIFFSNATLKLGRVPILWIPFFFYPGNRLSFNPAIGVSSEKGKFLNTTYELYGSYPGLGATGTAAETNSDDTSAMTANFLSLLSSDEDAQQIHSGWTYVNLDDAENLSKLQKWAFDTGSYLAVFADAWENYGLSIGYDTKNYLLNKKLTLSSVGVLSKRNKDYRYSFDFSGDYKSDNLSFSFSAPVLSDQNVRYDLLNRNTVFGLDAAFGEEQTFPSTYSYSISNYSVVLDGSASKKFGDISVDLSSLKTNINYEWNSKSKKFEIKDATFPYVSFKSSGVLVNVAGESTQKEETVKLNNATAQKFYDEYEQIKDTSIEEPQSKKFESMTLYNGSVVSTTKTVNSDGASLKLDYSYSQVLDNGYENKFEHSSFYNKIDSSVNVSGKLPNKLASINQSINPVYNSTVYETNTAKNSDSFKLKNSTKISFDRYGLSYGLANYIYVYQKDKSKTEDRVGKWDKTDVLEHYLNFSKTLNYFKLGLKYSLPPLEQFLTPSVSYSNGGLSASTDLTMRMEKDAYFKPTVGHASASYKFNFISTSLSSTYDFKKTGSWAGFTGNEKVSASLVDKRLVLSQTLSLKEKFKVNELAFNVSFDNSYIKYTFKDSDVHPDKLSIYLYQGVPARYFWKNRIGLDGNFDMGFTYDFVNKYNSSLYADMKFTFAINKFLDLSVSAKSVNNSFYRYYEKFNGKDVFKFNLLWKDFIKSFDFFGDGRKSTGFNLNTLSLSAVHYMEDWTLTLTTSSHIKSVNGKSRFVSDFTFLIKWNAIPELKSTNSWDETDGWEK